MCTTSGAAANYKRQKKPLLEMKIGFTGTRQGLTVQQEMNLDDLLSDIAIDTAADDSPIEFHHGDCIGADAQAHDIVDALPDRRIIIHPPSDPKYRAFKEGDEVRDEASYLERNTDIVDEGEDLLIACPKEGQEVLRSGTWSTIRRGRKAGRPVVIIYPDGNMYKSWEGT